MELTWILNYLGMWLLKGDSGAVDEWWVSEQMGGGCGKSVTAAGLVLQDGWEADVNCVLQRLQLRLLSPNKITHTTRFLNPSFRAYAWEIYLTSNPGLPGGGTFKQLGSKVIQDMKCNSSEEKNSYTKKIIYLWLKIKMDRMISLIILPRLLIEILLSPRIPCLSSTHIISPLMPLNILNQLMNSVSVPPCSMLY